MCHSTSLEPVIISKLATTMLMGAMARVKALTRGQMVSLPLDRVVRMSANLQEIVSGLSQKMKRRKKNSLRRISS